MDIRNAFTSASFAAHLGNLISDRDAVIHFPYNIQLLVRYGYDMEDVATNYTELPTGVSLATNSVKHNVRRKWKKYT